VCDLADHPWGGLAEMASERRGAGSRWNPDKSLSFVPLRPERVLEVRYDHMEGARFRHPPQFVRWRPDRDPRSCGYAQLERPIRYDLEDILGG
jgi:ATP-dependent DNA ligase